MNVPVVARSQSAADHAFATKVKHNHRSDEWGEENLKKCVK